VLDERLIVGTGVHDEKRPAFSGQPRMAVSKLADPKKWTSRREQEVSDGRLRFVHARADDQSRANGRKSGMSSVWNPTFAR
jgi:hypothetical protein